MSDAFIADYVAQHWDSNAGPSAVTKSRGWACNCSIGSKAILDDHRHADAAVDGDGRALPTGAAMTAADSAPYAGAIGDPDRPVEIAADPCSRLDALGMKGDYRRAHVKPDDLAAYITERRTDPARADAW